MEKLDAIRLVAAKSGRAKVSRVELPEALQKFNAANNTLRVRIVAVWAAQNTESDPNDCSSVLRQTVGNNEFSQIANLDGFIVKNEDGTPAIDQSAQSKVNGFKTAVVGKFFTATKYSVSIANLAKDLGDNYATLERVHDPIKKRTYGALSDCTLDPISDDDKAIMYERLNNRLQKRLVDGRLKPGSFIESTDGTSQLAGTQTISGATGATVTI